MLSVKYLGGLRVALVYSILPSSDAGRVAMYNSPNWPDIPPCENRGQRGQVSWQSIFSGSP